MAAPVRAMIEKSSESVVSIHGRPLYSEDAEQGVLGAVMLDNTVLARVAEIVQPDDFFDTVHGDVFEAMLSLHTAGVGIEPYTLADELTGRGALQRIGGKDFIGYLCDVVPTALSATYHAEIVLRDSQRRGVIHLMQGSIASLIRGEEGPDMVAERLRPALDAVALSRAKTVACLDDVEISNLPALSYVVDGELPRGGLVVQYGAPESGKSLYVLDVCFSVAAGRRSHGRAVERGPVFYVAGEGVPGIPSRIAALRSRYGYEGRQGVHFVTQPVNLMKADEVTRLIATIRANASAPVLIVFDTLHRCMAGADENSAQDMGVVLESCARLQREFGACVLLIHHVGKGSDIERGSGALRGGADAMVLAKKDGDVFTFTADKLKDGSKGAPLKLRLAQEGPSVVLVTANTGLQLESAEVSEHERRALHSLHTHFLAEGATATQWCKATGLSERDFYRARTRLVTRTYVDSPGSKRGGLYSLTPQGLTVVTANCNLTAS